MGRGPGKRQRVTQHVHHGKLQRDERLDNVRGILIILVVAGHFLLPLQEADTRLMDGLIYLIYVFHMPCFVLLSGYYSKSVYKNGRFRWGKVVQLLWLYFVYETILFFTERLAYGPTTRFPDYLDETGAPWYLLSLTLWYLTIPLFNRFRGKRGAMLIPLLMFPAVALLKYKLHLGPLLALDRTVSFLPFFYLGFFGTQGFLDEYLESRVRPVVDLVGFFFALLVLIGAKQLFMKYNLIVYGADYSRFPADMRGNLWWLTLLWNVMALTISLGLIGKTLNRRMAILTELGKNTLQIYILHRPIRDILMYLGMYERLDPYDRLQVIWILVISVLLTVLLGNRFFTILFKRLRTVFDPLLEKHGAL